MSNNNNNISTKHYPVLLEILPLFLFFILNKYYDIFVATAVLIIFSVVNLFVSYFYTKKVHAISVLTAILAVVFGGMTLFFHNEVFIKVKVSIINIIFAFILIAGSFLKINFLKILFQTNLQLTSKGWTLLNRVWITFFLSLALVNEIIWRNFSTEAWVNFKVFGILGLSIALMIVLFPIIKKHSLQSNDN